MNRDEIMRDTVCEIKETKEFMHKMEFRNKRREKD